MIVEAVRARGLIQQGQDGDDVRLVQQALICAGHQLIDDGKFGSITESAVERFQAANGCDVDGAVGEETAPFLDAALAKGRTYTEPAQSSVLVSAPWLSVARALSGTQEIPGSKSNPMIVAWADEIGNRWPDLAGNVTWYSNDDTPWCGLFAAICLTRAGYSPPSAPLGALNWWHSWADGVRLSGPALGAVLVKRRTGGGHVTFYECEDRHYYYCRGGNQSNRVNVSPIVKNPDVLGFMWPRTAPMPKVAPVYGTLADTQTLGSEV